MLTSFPVSYNLLCSGFCFSLCRKKNIFGDTRNRAYEFGTCIVSRIICFKGYFCEILVIKTIHNLLDCIVGKSALTFGTVNRVWSHTLSIRS